MTSTAVAPGPAALAASAAAPPRALRLGVSFVLGLLAGLACGAFLRRPEFTSDFEMVWRAARFLRDGVNPYGFVEYQGELIYGGQPQLYPLTTLWMVSLVAWLPVHVAGGVMFGAGTAALSYAITRDGLWRLHFLLSGPFLVALSLGQFVPFIMVAALLPAWGVLALLKPSIGLAALARHLSLRSAMVCGVVLAVSILAPPSWFFHWLRGGSASIQHVAPVTLVWGGPLLLLSALRWRTPSGRMLLAMALVPQSMFFYDLLMLWLIPRTRRESLLLTLSSGVGVVAWLSWSAWFREPYFFLAQPFAMLFCYLPALLILLRQPSEAALPAWGAEWRTMLSRHTGKVAA